METEFTIGDFKFVDCTSYSQGDKERIPTTFEAKLGEIRIVITNGHRDYRPEWIFRCYNLGFDVSQIRNCKSKEDAAKYAIKQCRKKAVSFYEELKCGDLKTKAPNDAKPVLAPVFDAMEYAYDHWGETLNYMSDDEIEQVNDCKNKDEVDDYLRCFYERT